MSEDIPFNRPSLEGNELDYMRDAVESGHTAMSGKYAAQASEMVREFLGAHDVLLTTSCTDALEMSAMLLELGPGDTVIVPSFTFVSTALAFARQGAQIAFCDIEDETLGLDPAHLQSLLDDTVRAVVPVHYAGVGCDMDGVSRALEGTSVEVIEDNAHGLFGQYRGRPLGTLGRFATLSFHETKNFICGEGGALILNDAADIDRAHVLYDKGTNRRAFMLGDVDKYSWQDTGSSFGMSEVLAAFLYGQLEQRETILTKRALVFDRYTRMLEPLAEEFGLRLPVVPLDRVQAFHMFYVLMPDRAARDHALTVMRERGVHPTFHYVPLHSSPGGQKFGVHAAECPVTDDVSGRLLRLPFYNNLTAAGAERVVDALRAALQSHRPLAAR
jgi:dTDP-4-amino-4,6-dideoxygalactose transaminase